uniref:HNH nuclease domain-containing protein n=1 Tax=viral metagenome TaxID=1070528 RepID=A0A6C0B1J0_9ZZZZ
MKLELLIFGVTAFFIYNTYYDGKYVKLFMKHKKYFQIAFFAFLGIIFYLLIKRNPARCKNILLHANNVVKYMPIDKSSLDMLSPLIDFTTNTSSGVDGSSFMGDLNSEVHGSDSAEKRILQSGGKSTKRSVSETKKKYVASQQGWKCGDCKTQLNAWFEVDHIKRLEHGGTNEITNLVALCRDCHGKKTAMENM